MATLACLALAWPATARADYVTGVQETLFRSADESVRDRWFDDARSVGTGIVRLSVGWDDVVAGRPADPANPDDPEYDFSGVDAQVVDAAERGLRVMFVFNDAPEFAEGPNRPDNMNQAPQGTWLPDPDAFGKFGEAIATRYSGSFNGLPRVSLFETWNEPNLPFYLTPQNRGGELVAANHYRRMQNAMHDAVHSVHAGNVTIAGSQAPYGDPAGGQRTRPLVFLRKLLCLNRELKAVGCPTKLRFDVMSHHPINLSGPPRQSAIHSDDVSSPDLRNLRRVLRAAERKGTVPGGRHKLWVTEFWWEHTLDRPQPAIPSPEQHGRYIEEAMYLYWKQGASVVMSLLLIDERFTGDSATTLQTGLRFANGNRKPAYTAFRFPFVTERRSKRKLFAWGRAPASGELVIERKRSGDWRRVERLNGREGKVFTAKLRERGRGKFRARIGDDTSLVWKQGKRRDRIFEPTSGPSPAG